MAHKEARVLKKIMGHKVFAQKDMTVKLDNLANVLLDNLVSAFPIYRINAEVKGIVQLDIIVKTENAKRLFHN